MKPEVAAAQLRNAPAPPGPEIREQVLSVCDRLPQDQSSQAHMRADADRGRRRTVHLSRRFAFPLVTLFAADSMARNAVAGACYAMSRRSRNARY